MPVTGRPPWVDEQQRRECYFSPTCKEVWDFPGHPVAKTLPSSSGGLGSVPGLGTKIPHAVQFGSKKEMSFFGGWGAG